MSKALTPRKCSQCGKRRKPAKRSNGRASTKCKECFGGQFWLSEFGRWFADAAKRQSSVSMPLDEDDIVGIYDLWVERKHASGYKLRCGQLKHRYDYHISHRDPATGEGFQGRFTTGNLIIATAVANKKAYNHAPIDHGFRVYTDKKPFGTAAKVREWCGGQYDLLGIVNELGLKKYTPKKFNITNINPDFLPKGTSPQITLESQLRRFEGGSTHPWRHTTYSPTEAFTAALVYGIGLGDGVLKVGNEEPLAPPEVEF